MVYIYYQSGRNLVYENVPKVKEIKIEKEIIPEKKVTNLHKSKFTQKTEKDYNLMMI